MRENTNAQNLAPHLLLNSEPFVRKMNQMTQMNQMDQMNKNKNTQNLAPHRPLIWHDSEFISNFMNLKCPEHEGYFPNYQIIKTPKYVNMTK